MGGDATDGSTSASWPAPRAAPHPAPSGLLREGLAGLVSDLLETSERPIAVLDPDCHFLYANRAMQARLEVDADGVDRVTVTSLVEADELERVRSEAWPALRRDGVWEGHVSAKASGTEPEIIALTVRAHADGDGRVRYVSVIAEDDPPGVAMTAELVASEARFRAMAERSHDLVALFVDGRFAYASPSHARVIGYQADELIGEPPTDFIHPDDVERVMERFEEQLLRDAPQEPVEFRHRHRDGGWVHVEAVATNLVDDPAVRGIVVNTRDVTDRRRAELLAADQARILERVARGAPLSDTLAEVVAMVEQFVEGGCGAIALLDEAAHSLRVVAAPRLPPACVEVLDGYTAHPATAARLTSPGLVSDVEIAAPRVSAALRAHGFESWWSAPIRSSGSDPILGVAMMFRTDEKDPTEADEGLLELAANVAAICVERTRAATQLEHLALHDPLTGLANRAQLIDRLGHAVLHPRTGGPYGAVLFLDVDRFKTLNDRLGHAAGDNLLREIGARIRSATRPGDLVARLGGDEFLVLCQGLNDPENAVEIAGRVLDTLRQRVDLGGTQTSVTASIGVALFQGGDPMDVLRNADAAMYRAKELGRDRFELFDETLRIEEQARRVLDEELRALAEGDVAGGTVVLAYDPIVQITTRHLVGFDVRASWEHPQRGIVLPGEFLATADDAAVAALLAERVWSDSLRRVQRWRASLPGADGLVVGIPLTVRELTDVQVVDRVTSLLAETETAPEHVLVQVAESALIEDAATVEMSLRALRDAGVRIALGEFGAAHSSLLHLERFAIDVVRIDAAFIAGMLDRPGRLAIVRAVVDLAKELGISTIAEGVRTAAESERLGELGCDLAQGPWYSRALTGSEAETLLARSGPELEVVT